MAGSPYVELKLGAPQALGVVGDSPFSLVVTDQPWNSGLDALVVSAGQEGLGQLGGTLTTVFPGIDWSPLDAAPLVPDHPVPIRLPPPNTPEAADLRWAIATTVRDAVRPAGNHRPARRPGPKPIGRAHPQRRRLRQGMYCRATRNAHQISGACSGSRP